MFSKAKSKDGGSTAAKDHDTTQSASGATQRMAGKPRPASRTSNVPSIISSDVVIKGAIESAGEIQFDGEIDGNLEAKGVVIGDGARVVGEVAADKVRVCGNVEGSIRGVQVELAASAQVKGDIVHASLSIENGARFEGNCRHSDNPLSSGPAPLKPKKPKPIPASPTADASAQQFDGGNENASHGGPAIDAEILDEPATDGSRKLMPLRNEPAPDKTFVSKPSVGNLR
ncbi:MAG: bactofilin family protein [Parvularcula sp.]